MDSMRSVGPAILALIGCWCMANPEATAQDLATRVDAYLKPLADQGEFMGAVLVARDGKVLFAKGYGLAEVAWSVPNSVETRFEIASLTKQFTALAVLQFAERGMLKLDDPVSKYYPNAPSTWEKITIHHLLTHTSGIPNNGLADFKKGLCVSYSLPDLISLFRDKPLSFEPGTKWAYTNTEYNLLGLIIEHVSRMSYGDYLRTNIFEPIGMKDSGYAPTTAVVLHKAQGYTREGKELRLRDFFDRSLEFAAGGIHTTVQDMLRWDQALYSEKVVGRKSLDLMFTGHPPGNYGYGWFIKVENGKVKAFHEGNDPGVAAFEARYPQDRAFVVVLANLETSPVRRIADDLAAMLFGEKRDAH